MRALIQITQAPSQQKAEAAMRHLGDSPGHCSSLATQYNTILLSLCICYVLVPTPGFVHEMSQQRDIGVQHLHTSSPS